MNTYYFNNSEYSLTIKGVQPLINDTPVDWAIVRTIAPFNVQAYLKLIVADLNTIDTDIREELIKNIVTSNKEIEEKIYYDDNNLMSIERPINNLWRLTSYKFTVRENKEYVGYTQEYVNSLERLLNTLTINKDKGISNYLIDNISYHLNKVEIYSYDSTLKQLKAIDSTERYNDNINLSMDHYDEIRDLLQCTLDNTVDFITEEFHSAKSIESSDFESNNGGYSITYVDELHSYNAQGYSRLWIDRDTRTLSKLEVLAQASRLARRSYYAKVTLNKFKTALLVAEGNSLYNCIKNMSSTDIQEVEEVINYDALLI